MRTGRTMKVISIAGAAALAAALMILTTAVVSAGPTATPIVDGRLYGDNDIANYDVLAEALGGRGTLYYKLEGSTLYAAVVVSSSVNDNVFACKKNCGDDGYLTDAEWLGGPGHSFDDLWGSDNLGLSFSCGGTTWTWQQGYLYDADGDRDPLESDWLSDELDGSGGSGAGTAPPGTVSRSTLQWNMNNSSWKVNYGGRSYNSYKSPDGDDDDALDDEEGWKTTWYWYTPTLPNQGWEWRMGYELSLDVSACSDSWELDVISAHNSPSKDGNEDVEILLGKITIIKEVYDKFGNPGEHIQDFDFSGDLGSFQLDDHSDVTLPDRRTFLNLTQGTYSVSETLPSTNWSLLDITCDASSYVTDYVSAEATIDLAPNEHVTCTFKNILSGGDTAVVLSSLDASSGRRVVSLLVFGVAGLAALAAGGLWANRRRTV
jgi:hypothetical protein